jgi:transcriptional regulator with XRE-family HTH domain
MTKNLERDRARQLRKEQGLSIIEIAEKIGVSKGSVSVWVRDIALTPEQEAYLSRSNASFRAHQAGARTNKAKFREFRQQYQNEGRAKAREGDLLHVQGCMLYWAEGNKDRAMIRFANSDPDMMIAFAKFLRQSLFVPEEKITFYVHCYIGNGVSLENIEDHWLKLLDLNRSQLRKTIVNNQPTSSQQKGRKLLYGVGHLTVTSTRYIQHVYGAIQEYMGINRPEWLE